jgi:2-amino-4-hydroxy-6-hydroxymethyldihydropteridine diphosphokinase
MMKQVFLGLGSNLNNRKSHLEDALEKLDGHSGIHILKQSSILQTEPIGEIEQPMFLNMVVEIETNLSPFKLLDLCLAIELENGRVRGQKWGPRSLDIDILFYGSQIIDCSGLQIPHPEVTNRRFVLEPLAEIAPTFEHPILSQSVHAMLQLL